MTQLGAVPKLVGILPENTEAEALLVQATRARALRSFLTRCAPHAPRSSRARLQVTATLGSLAYGDKETLALLMHSDALTPLLDLLCHPSAKVDEAAACTIKILLQSPDVPMESITQSSANCPRSSP